MTVSYKKWHIPVSKEKTSLIEAIQSLAKVPSSKVSMPLIVRLVENPDFKLPFITLFHGAVGIKQHDYIHMALGRGLLPKDEAFVIGMTMGSTGKISVLEKNIYCLISRYLYPKIYQFNKQDCQVFKQSVNLAEQMQCASLDTFPFEQYMDTPLAEIREIIGIDTNLLIDAYTQEQESYPADSASGRLLMGQTRADYSIS